MKKLTENMWNEVLAYNETKEAEILENGVTLEDYMLCATELVENKNNIVITGLKSLKAKSQNVAKAFAEGHPLTDTMFNSKTDAMFIDACIVEGEFHKENYLYEAVLKTDISEYDRFNVKDVHTQVGLVKEICVKQIDGAINDANFARDEYIAYTKSNEGMKK